MVLPVIAYLAAGASPLKLGATEMNDSIRFTPEKLSVKAAETVRFFIVNKGKVPHEIVIGTAIRCTSRQHFFDTHQPRHASRADTLSNRY